MLGENDDRMPVKRFHGAPSPEPGAEPAGMPEFLPAAFPHPVALFGRAGRCRSGDTGVIEAVRLQAVAPARPGCGLIFAPGVPRMRRRGVPAAASGTGSEPGERGEGAAVVVIEDDPAQLTGLEMLLSAWGYRAICARAADQACAELGAQQIVPDVVVSDFRLSGGGTGIDAINTIRAAVGRPVPGIVVTGDTDPLRLREAKESGFRLLHKPYAPEELRSVIAAALSGGVACPGRTGPERPIRPVRR